MRFLCDRTSRKLILGLMFVSLSVSCAAPQAFASDPGGPDETVTSQEEAGGAAPRDDGDVLRLKEIDATVYAIIYEPEVPLRAAPYAGTWSPVNLVMALASLVVSALIVIALLAGMASRGERADGGGFPLSALRPAGACVGVVSVAMFVLTEDVHGVMLPVNGSTWIMALILAAQLAVVGLSALRAISFRRSPKDVTDNVAK
jgi:hypothetical protein